MDKEERRSDRRASIIQAAMTVFAAHGYQGATMDEIARQAGVAKGTPYLYFTDKAGLFYAVFETWTAEALEASEKSMSSARNASEALTAIAINASDFMEEHREWFPLTLEVWSASSSPALRDRFAIALDDLYARYRGAVSGIIRLGQESKEFRDDLDADALAATLTGAIDGLFLQCWFDPTLDSKRLLKGLFDALMRGITRPSKDVVHE